MTAADGTSNPYQTIQTTFFKDPGHPDLNKRSSVDQAIKSSELYDSKGQVIYKVDESHGLRNGGTIYHQTHGRPDHMKQTIRAYTCSNKNNTTQSNRKQTQRRISLVKQMLNNERRASSLVYDQLVNMTKSLHLNDPTIVKTSEFIKHSSRVVHQGL